MELETSVANCKTFFKVLNVVRVVLSKENQIWKGRVATELGCLAGNLKLEVIQIQTIPGQSQPVAAVI